MTEKTITPLLKAVSITYYVFAVLTLLIVMGMFVLGSLLLSMLGNLSIPGLSIVTMFGSVFFGIVGFFNLAFAVLYFFIARGLGKAQTWARIVAIVLSSLVILFGLIGLAYGGTYSLLNIPYIVLYGGIGYVLVFHKESIACFK